eukprot:363563-Chlamydomonas_euryale.AAC.10
MKREAASACTAQAPPACARASARHAPGHQQGVHEHGEKHSQPHVKPTVKGVSLLVGPLYAGHVGRSSRAQHVGSREELVP